MEATFTAPSVAACTFLLLVIWHSTPALAERQETARQLAQQENVVTATVSAATKADACNSSIDKAYNLCMIQGLFNIKHVFCDCTQSDVAGPPTWECVGTAECQK